MQNIAGRDGHTAEQRGVDVVWRGPAHSSAAVRDNGEGVPRRERRGMHICMCVRTVFSMYVYICIVCRTYMYNQVVVSHTSAQL